MASLTPHRDAIEVALTRHAAAMAALAPPDCAAEMVNRELGRNLTALLMRAYADAQDRDVAMADFVSGLANAIGNGCASIGGSITRGDKGAAGLLVTTVLMQAQRTALRGIGGAAEAQTEYDYAQPESGRA